ncbi:Hsp20/alpha crystallin family protein [Microbulbifer flavimaris]|uniref:Hsp20/alpha crystallin family protein n=1 Tax=Microbulbifer flavimaris TaxID=1781068 RepID=A0ABX4I1I5_9GAMM|nr:MULTISPECIES: Hsp20/alpha crystallin family protein [Microbulbifer]KUJ83498.1 heat-shock protein Hsp20 [Microbulbifer sp. ZGT114]PCO05658.1 Hsp20/alpha crystallin family protein [Microbulbifer flavimaris]
MSLIPRGSLMDLDNMFEQMLSPSRLGGEAKEGFFSPRIDVRETEKSYEISAELPGVTKDDISVTLEDGVLTLEAEVHREEKQEEEGRVIRQERRYGKYMRSFNLGADVSESDIDASFRDGVLTLKAPKREVTQPRTQRIEIH